MRNEISQPLPNSQLEQPAGISQAFIIEEVMRKLQAILDQKPKERGWKRFLTHPLVLLLVSAVLGGAITLVYSGKQNQLAAERSFSDELNKQRIQKRSEVWERLDEDEGVIERLLNQPDELQNPNDRNERAKQIEKLIQEDRRTIDKYRFWLGESHAKIHEYLDASSLYAMQKLLGVDGKVEALSQHREGLKSDLDKEREKSLQDLADRAKATRLFYFF